MYDSQSHPITALSGIVPWNNTVLRPGVSGLPSVSCKTRSLHTLCKLRGIGANIREKFQTNKKNEENLLKILHFFVILLFYVQNYRKFPLFLREIAR